MKKKIMMLGLCLICLAQAALSPSQELLNAPILNISPEDAGLLLEALPASEVLGGSRTAEEAGGQMHALPFFGEENIDVSAEGPVPSGANNEKADKNIVKFTGGSAHVNAPAAVNK